jgi:DNA-binding NarL/FixJ family response regulator
VKVVIADDQALVRAGLRMILESHADIEVVAEAGDGEEAVAACKRYHPDVVLMDVRMPKLNGLEVLERIAGLGDPTTKVLILTTFDLDEYVYDALRDGASGFLVKDVRPAQLIEALRGVMDGDAVLAPSVTKRLIEKFMQPSRLSVTTASLLDRLTPRETEVLKLVARGLKNSEIAEALFLSESTVKTHMARLLSKLELRDRAQAVVLAYESGLVAVGDNG